MLQAAQVFPVRQDGGEVVAGVGVFPLDDIGLDALGIGRGFDAGHVNDAVSQFAVDFLVLQEHGLLPLVENREAVGGALHWAHALEQGFVLFREGPGGFLHMDQLEAARMTADEVRGIHASPPGPGGVQLEGDQVGIGIVQKDLDDRLVAGEELDRL